ncbi:hypothetical protein PFISCL1PPCAC_13364, partial [Pristionchus fissidentatus]
LEFKSNDRDELFSFDGLTPSTWFVFRIHYRVLFHNSTEKGEDLVTKQELVVHTKPVHSHLPPTKIEDIVASVEETFTTTQNLYVSVKSVFSDNNNIMTVVVPELRCPGRGIVKPLAQQVKGSHARFHFDITSLGQEIDLFECKTVCFFPFLRVSMRNRTSETFRAREWCGSITRVIEIGTANDSPHPTVALFLSLITVPLLLR